MQIQKRDLIPSMRSCDFVVLGLAVLVSFYVAGCGVETSPTPAPLPPSPSPTTHPPSPRFQLPERIIAGYTGNANVTLISKAVEDGVNVLFWSFMQFHGNFMIGPITSELVTQVHDMLVSSGRDVIHVVSFGGWNSPHLLAGTCGSKMCSATKYASAFKAWDDEMKANVSGFQGFAGIDWDLEGLTNLSDPSNEFSLETYEMMLGISKAVRRDGYLVSIVPAQSYFDCTQSGFDPSLRHKAPQAPEGWRYHGRNAYAVIYAKCPECFDLVMPQYYEGYSLDGFLLYWNGSTENIGAEGWPKDGTAEQETRIVKANIECLLRGWNVDFDGYMGLPNATKVVVPAEKLVVALSNAQKKFKVPFFSGGSSGKAWCEASQRIRGFAYWTIARQMMGDSRHQSLIRDLRTTMESTRCRWSLVRG